MKSGSPLIDLDILSLDYIEKVSQFNWDYPNDLDPTGISDYKEVYLAGMSFLYNQENSKATQYAYASELEKFLQWMFRVKRKSAFSMNENDLADYFDFVKSPYPAWVSKSQEKKFILLDGVRKPNPKWRPFRETKGSSKNTNTIKKAFTFLKSFYAYLRIKNLVRSNPFDLINKKAILPSRLSKKSLSKKILHSEDRELLETTLDSLVEKDPRFSRERFIVIAMLNMYLRVSDLAEYRGVIPVMGDFYYRRTDGWWFVAYGKGNKEADIAANDRVIDALKHYRETMGLTPLPYASDETPLILMRGGKKAIRSTRHLNDILHLVMSKVIGRAKELGWGSDDIERLESFTTHWLRHTGISDGIKHRPIAHVQQDARHVTLATTSDYVETEDADRYASSNS